MLSSSSSSDTESIIPQNYTSYETSPTTFNPLIARNIVNFLKIVSKLKHTLRTGWVDCKVQHPESIASHMYRMGIISMLTRNQPNIDTDKCIKMSLVHDLSEAIAGDITPHAGVSKEEKYRLEREAIERMRSTLLEGVNDTDKESEEYIQTVNEMLNLWQEYEDGTSPEAIIMKDIDRFDMVLQALEYETEQNLHLKTFYESTKGGFQTDMFKTLMKEVYAQKDQLEEQRRKK
ncbi:hypothetical protein FDP41_005947 [Naegleria fowleri]|uniref:5'-deoxynucleotidase n=1 Tax=Naegleria fowleri TaxID=5763 RepID=A0A6A5BMA6_NAEFO|nr:uncharacterized protein FDP41_005947 [Naegleria fowleri]KAF0975194.1 hypothetical protein FDP41_005947 [Naegleria fowleri]CAG4713496.1 unnamed protein product [Naegleria fowleri]